MNIFGKTYLDNRYMDSLNMLLIREGLISEEDKQLNLHPLGRHSNRNLLRRKTLLMLTLFEEIDADYGVLDYQYLIEEGVLNRNSCIVCKKPDNQFFGDENHEAHVASKDVTRSILLNGGKSLINDHVRNSPPDFYKKNNSSTNIRKHRSQLITRDPFNYFEEDRGRISRVDLAKKYQELAEYVLNHDDCPQFYSDSGKKFDGYYALGEQILTWKENVEYCSKVSILNNASFSSSLITHISRDIKHVPSDNDLIDDIMYLVQVDLGNEFKVLPSPNSLKDVFRLRNSKEISQYREHLSEWMTALKNGDAKIEAEIRKDISRANNTLKRVQRWHEFQSSPINFWLNSVGGHIPIFSNILTAVNTVGKLATDWGEKRNGWFILMEKF